MRYRISYRREDCVGELSCESISPELWIRAEDGKASLAEATYNPDTGCWERNIGEEEYEKQMVVADVCPTRAVRIEAIDDDDEYERRADEEEESGPAGSEDDDDEDEYSPLEFGNPYA